MEIRVLDMLDQLKEMDLAAKSDPEKLIKADKVLDTIRLLKRAISDIELRYLKEIGFSDYFHYMETKKKVEAKKEIWVTLAKNNPEQAVAMLLSKIKEI